MFSVSFNGITDMESGVLAVRRPSIPAPVKVYEEIIIPGRDGALYVDQGRYEPIVIPVEFNFMSRPSEWGNRYREAQKWLSGSGELTFSDDQYHFYRVYYAEITDTERTSRRIGTFTAEFHCDPYAYLISGKEEMEKSAVEYNPYEICHPTYIITGEGMCGLAVNGKSMTANISGSLSIDTENMEAVNGSGQNRNTSVNGDYEDLWLNPGNNTIGISSGFQLGIIPNWREL